MILFMSEAFLISFKALFKCPTISERIRPSRDLQHHVGHQLTKIGTLVCQIPTWSSLNDCERVHANQG
jgi:hypothetical protein